MDSIYIGRSGLRAQQQVIEAISNNISNLNSPSYKRQEVTLSNVIALQNSSGLGEGGRQFGMGVILSAHQRSMAQGQVQKTEHPLDLAIQGSGFLVLQRSDGGVAYSRGGTFSIDADGYVVDSHGSRLLPELHLDEKIKSISVGPDGLISAELIDGSIEEMGQLELAYFLNPEALQQHADGTYTATELSGDAISTLPGENGAGSILQGYLEGSNVNLVEEFTSLVMAQRAYEASARVVQTAGDLFDAANELLRR
ncbi:flagellar hook-basal body protein [Chitinibacteraceae bacterium HSL-7]